MKRISPRWMLILTLVLALVLAACGGDTPGAPAPPAAPTSAPAAETAAQTAADGGCPVATVLDPMGLTGQYPKQFELAEFEQLADCTLTFSDNPEISALNERLNSTSDLPTVTDRLPAEPLVIAPHEQPGLYGGRLNGISKSPENGTSDFMSVRHVNLVRLDDDLQTIVPNIAKGWEYNDDYTELTFFLRKGHKWSDGAPFTAEDVSFWYNDIHMNSEYFPNVDSRWIFGGEPMQVEVVDETTVKFRFAAPAPNFLLSFTRTYIQPFQPKHVLGQFHPTYNSNADAEAKALGFDDWIARFRLYYHDWKDTYHPLSGPAGSEVIIPTLESHVLVEETPELRRFLANPYFHMVDTAGQQLPYINEHYEQYSENDDVTILKMINGEIDYKQQSIELPHFPELKRNEERGNYRVFLPPAPGGIAYYAFNITHQDPEMAKILGDVRFRQAMSHALNRAEMNEVVYLGQGTPQQALPADYKTVAFVNDEARFQFTEYDPARANQLLDEMGLTARGSDGFRLRFDGRPLVVLLQYAPQENPVQNHELAKEYWEDVGVRVELKEVTSDLYRQESAANRHDIATWNNGGTGVEIVDNTQIMVPPFGDYLGTRTGTQWNDWMVSNGANGIEPPDDVKRLYQLAEEFKSHPLGSEESNRIGAEVIDIHARYLFNIGLVGDIPAPVFANNRVGNVAEFTIKGYAYYWAYQFRPVQWYIKQ
jgi:peptide/nickel transport system substrate-binding protein